MAVKKGILENFLKPSSHYNDNQKNFRSIFIDNDDDLKPESPTSDVITKSFEGDAPSSHAEISSEKPFVIPPSFDFELANNKETIGKQLVNEIRKQLVNNKETIGKQTVKAKVTLKMNKETIGKPISKQNKEVIGKQLVTQLVNNNPDVSMLTGLQKGILFYIVEDCIYRGQLISGLITNETIRELTKANADVVKTSVQRLIQKGYIKRNPNKEGKRGKGGFSSFIITEEIRDGVLKEKRNPAIGKQLVNQLVNDISKQLVNDKETNKETIASSSSSELKITTTPDDQWNFNIIPYARFGFTASHTKQLAKLDVISVADVEQSLIEFSFDLDENKLPPIKTTKINFLMGLLRAGHSYVSEGFRNEQEAAISEMARRAESKRKKLLEEKFLAWEASLSDAERKEIEDKLPTHLMVFNKAHGIGNPEVRNWFFNYFLKTDIVSSNA